MDNIGGRPVLSREIERPSETGILRAGASVVFQSENMRVRAVVVSGARLVYFENSEWTLREKHERMHL